MSGNGSVGPIDCCDRDCAEANGCEIGGCFCVGCERWFCANEMGNEEYCKDCLDERERDEEDDHEER